MTRRTLFALVLTILSVALFSSDAGSLVRDIVSSELQDRVLGSASARVIVKVRLPGGPHVPEGRLAGAAVSRQQADIASVQAQIMGRLAATPHRLLHRYRTVPLLALEVGPAALAELAASSLQVERVVEDGLSAPTVAQSAPLIQAQKAWANGFDGTGWMVAILDTGVDTTHPFLAAKVTEAACYSSTVRNTSTTLCPNGQEEQTGPGAGVNCLIDTCWHGTHVAGIAAGSGVGAGVSFSGVARGAEIMAIQVFSRFDNPAECAGSAPCVLAWDSDLIAGLERLHALRAVHTFAAANVNVSGGLSTSSCDDEPIKLIIDNLRSVGIATVVSAGNDGATGAMSFPACVSTAISVGSTTKGDGLSSFSDISALTSLLAPGEAIASSVPGNGYAAASGTSMAAAHVAGAWAILRQAAPSATVDEILLALQSTGLPISDTRSGGSVIKPRIRISQALSALGVVSMGGVTPSGGFAGPAATPTLTLSYNGKLRDRVGQDNLALAADGALDGTLTATLSASGGRTVTGLRLDSDAPGIWDTNNGNVFWVLGVAPTLDGALLNAPGTMAVNFAVADGGSFVVFASDYQASEFLPGRTLTLTATFADGSTATTVTTVPGAPGPATLTLVYNGTLQDRVGQNNTALAADGALDGTLTATLSASGGRTVTGLRLDSDAPGIWDTNNGNVFWVLGVAPTLDGALLNAPGTMAVNFAVADGGSFVVFASDYQASEFLPGRTLTLTATFADGSTATAVTTVPGAPGAATLTLVYNGKLQDRVGQDNLALAADGALDGALTATLSASGGRTVTGLRLDSDAPGIWDTNNGNVFWVLGVAPTLDGALLNAPGTMAVNFAVADGGSFVVFAADYQASEFLPGRTLTLTATFADGSSASATTTVASEFTTSLVANGISDPTAMAFAPDGRLFVAEQGGRLRVIKNGALLQTEFVTVTTDPDGERGLLGVAFDPNFPTNQFVYVYYTAATPTIHNRVSRFTASGDVAVPGSEAIILDLDPLSTATNHNGGAIHFGLDGKLYIGVGENANGANSQTLTNLLGKLLRINPDGSIPSDNPFFGSASGANRAIWALGLRNPFTFAIQPGTGRLFINDVGEKTWEEIDDGIAGSNYGWPTTEGPTADPSFRSPLFAYGHGTSSTTGCAIAGGAFYNPTTVQFPSDFVGDYFFADLCSGWIRRFDPVSGIVTDFASSFANPVDLQVGADGRLYVLSRGDGAVHAIRHNGN